MEDTKGLSRHIFPSSKGVRSRTKDSYDGSLIIDPFVNVDERTRSKDFLRRYLMYVSGGSRDAPGYRGDLPPSGAERKAATRRE